MPDLDMTTRAIIAAGAVLTVLAGWWRWLRPAIHKGRQDGVAIRDAILGRDPVVDSITGKELAPALPGIGHRMAVQEGQMSEMTRAVSQLAETHAQLIQVDKTLLDHDARIAKLEQASVERIVNRQDSANAWRAMEAATKATPDQEADPLP